MGSIIRLATLDDAEAIREIYAPFCEATPVSFETTGAERRRDAPTDRQDARVASLARPRARRRDRRIRLCEPAP